MDCRCGRIGLPHRGGNIVTECYRTLKTVMILTFIFLFDPGCIQNVRDSYVFSYDEA